LGQKEYQGIFSYFEQGTVDDRLHDYSSLNALPVSGLLLDAQVWSATVKDRYHMA
jgi:hypothetical protein